MAFIIAGIARGVKCSRCTPLVQCKKSKFVSSVLPCRLYSQEPSQVDEEDKIGEDLLHPDQPESALPKWPHNVAYFHYNEEEEKYLKYGWLDKRTNILPRDRPGQERDLGAEVDPESEPFRQLYIEGNDVVTESREVPNAWFWVQRLLPQPVTKMTVSEDQTPMPSGWRPAPARKPEKSYFIGRNRLMDYPVAKCLQRVHRTGVRLDARFLEPEPIVTTEISNITGAIRDAEHDILSYLYDVTGYGGRRKILSAVDEWGGVIKINGDFVFPVVEWLQREGF